MGQGEAVRCGKNIITYLEQSRTSIDSKKLKQEQPELAAHYTTTTTFRVLRSKKGE
jgi:hypothetical protein